jgi:hypothetical protein
VVYWVPLYGARPVGIEGDITVKLSRKTGPTVVRSLALWSSLRADAASATSWQQTQATLPDEIDPAKPYVVTPFDAIGNAGIPRIVIDGATVPSKGLYGGGMVD